MVTLYAGMAAALCVAFVLTVWLAWSVVLLL